MSFARLLSFFVPSVFEQNYGTAHRPAAAYCDRQRAYYWDRRPHVRERVEPEGCVIDGLLAGRGHGATVD